MFIVQWCGSESKKIWWIRIPKTFAPFILYLRIHIRNPDPRTQINPDPHQQRLFILITQTDSTPLDKYHLRRLKWAYDVWFWIIEGLADYFKCTLVAPLCHLYFPLLCNDIGNELAEVRSNLRAKCPNSSDKSYRVTICTPLVIICHLNSVCCLDKARSGTSLTTETWPRCWCRTTRSSRTSASAESISQR